VDVGIAWPETHDNLTNMESWRRADVPVLPGSGPAPRLHDTATGELVLAAAGPVATLYACGITPYDATHMGHAATYTAWDLLVRAWLDAAPETPAYPGTPEARGNPEPSRAPGRYAVVYVQNVTDVDDPLLERAERDGGDWRELARRETQRYREDMEALRVLPPDHLIGAVEALPVIERFSARMADRGALYNVDEDIYFARSADPGFGSLSGPGTACGYGPAEMAELAAALSPADHPFARVYVHAGMVSYHGEKMSKSLGNLVFVSRLLADGVDPMAIRMALLAHHYRSDWEWTDAVLGDARARLARWRAALARTEAAAAEAVTPGTTPAAIAEMVLSGVRARMRDDLDAPGALAVVDHWADTLVAEPPTRITTEDLAGARLVKATVDALLGVRLQ